MNITKLQFKKTNHGVNENLPKEHQELINNIHNTSDNIVEDIKGLISKYMGETTTLERAVFIDHMEKMTQEIDKSLRDNTNPQYTILRDQIVNELVNIELFVKKDSQEETQDKK